MIRSFLASGRNYLNNIPGKSIPRKIVVFESDDWGSIRMPSRAVYDDLVGKGVALDNNPYNKYDSLESEDDMEQLFNTLSGFSDIKGNHPIITTNFVMANPDFEKIRESGYKEYAYERFTDTYKMYPQSENVWELVQQGISRKLIKAQFHGREHLNVSQWLEFLQMGHPQVRQAFDSKVFCLDIPDNNMVRSNLMAAFDFKTEQERQFVLESIEEGLQMFSEIFGYESASMIAPCNVWDDHAEKTAKSGNVKFIQGLKGRCIPQIEAASYKRHFPSMGLKNPLGQYYFVRNVYFEPATNHRYNWMFNSMRKIEAAFFCKKPAIISTHRINYIGSLYPENRAKNLEMLSELIQKILRKWPDVEFMSTDELGKLYEASDK